MYGIITFNYYLVAGRMSQVLSQVKSHRTYGLVTCDLRPILRPVTCDESEKLLITYRLAIYQKVKLCYNKPKYQSSLYACFLDVRPALYRNEVAGMGLAYSQSLQELQFL